MEPTGKYARDPEDNSKADRDAESRAMAEVQKIGQNGTIIANKIGKDFIDKGHVRLTGQRVTNVADLAVLAEVYRNPSFETFRLIFMKGDTVVGQAGVTSRMPGVVTVFDNNTDVNAQFHEWKRQMIRVEADGYYMLHNHPSGLPDPSPSDMGITARFRRMLPGYKDHVIINGSTFAALGQETDRDNVPIIKKRDAASFGSYREGASPTIDNEFLGRKINGPQDVYFMAASLREADTFQLIGRNRKGVTGIATFPVSDLQNMKPIKALAVLRKFARMTGSQDMIAVNVPAGAGYIKGIMNTAVKKGALVEWVDTDNNSAYESGIRQETTTPPGTKAREVREAPVDMTGVLEASLEAPEGSNGLTEVNITAESGDTRVSMNAKWWQEAIDDRLEKLNKLRGCA